MGVEGPTRRAVLSADQADDADAARPGWARRDTRTPGPTPVPPPLHPSCANQEAAGPSQEEGGVVLGLATGAMVHRRRPVPCPRPTGDPHSPGHGSRSWGAAWGERGRGQ